MSTDEQLGQQIADAIAYLELPDIDVSERVLRTIELDPLGHDNGDSGQRSPSRTGASEGRWWPRVAAAAVIAAIAVLAIEPARTTVARWLGIGATGVEIDPSLDVDSLPTPDRGADGDVDQLDDDANGEPAIDVDSLVDSQLGPPDAFTWSDAGVAVLSWHTRDGWPALDDRADGADSEDGATAIELSVRPTGGEPALKIATADDQVQQVAIPAGDDPVAALWLGADHALVTSPGVAPTRAARVLLWEVDGYQFRLESNGTLDDVIVFASSIDAASLAAALSERT